MKTYDLSILIPARQEMFTARTVEDLLQNKQGNTEILVGLDGAWSEPGIPDHPDVTVVYTSVSWGQRGMTNQLARLSKAKYIAKVDAHCAFDEGFDVKLMADMQDDWTMVPIMRNLHAFDWKCMQCGKKTYQGPTPKSCEDCDNTTNFKRKMYWFAKPSPQSKSYCFDSEPHFQYFREFNKRPEGQGNLTESMSLQGSFFMLTREKYWELGVCDEDFGSWGSQGIEVAVKTWLSGGRVIVNHNTWYAHMFRTQGGDFSFPYPQHQSRVNAAKAKARTLFFEEGWPLQKYPLSWLVEKFWPVPGWTDEDLARIKTVPPSSKGIIYYTDNQLNLKLAHRVQKQLKSTGLPITSASLKRMDNMGKNVHLPLKRGVITYFKQIIAALEASSAENVFFCEHDVLYHPSHFDFTPPTKDKFYYNHNVWRVRPDGLAVTWEANQVAELCCSRELALEFYRRRLPEIEQNFNRSYEPGGRDVSKYESWHSEFPNIDIRHGGNLTKSKWSLRDFRDKSTAVNFQQSTIDKIPGWQNLKELLYTINK